MKRVIIFIDGSNVYHNLKKLFEDKIPSSFNYKKFIESIVGEDILIKTYYYNCSLDWKKDPEKYARQQRFFSKLRKIPNFELILCRMQKVNVDGKIIYQVKEDDIHLASDMIDLAYKNFYDRAILVSSDGDFAPAVEIVKKAGKEVENIGFEDNFSWHLKQKCTKFQMITKDKLKDFFE